MHDVKFDELRQVRLIVEESRGRRGRKNVNHYLVCEKKDGTSDKVPMDNDVARESLPHVLERMLRRGIHIVDDT